MKIKAIAASIAKDKENGWSYSKSALMNLIETIKHKPVTYNKKTVGIVESGEYENGKIILHATISNTDNIFNKKLYMIPGGLTDFEVDGDIIRKCKAHHCFLTDSTSNIDLSPIESVA